MDAPISFKWRMHKKGRELDNSNNIKVFIGDNIITIFISDSNFITVFISDSNFRTVFISDSNIVIIFISDSNIVIVFVRTKIIFTETQFNLIPACISSWSH